MLDTHGYGRFRDEVHMYDTIRLLVVSWDFVHCFATPI